MAEKKIFYKTVEGSEGSKCRYPTRLDTYGCGCQHDCSYCYAKSLLAFRGYWDPKRPQAADLTRIRKKVESLPRGAVVRLGGMTDCFQPIELQKRITMKTLQILNENRVGYLIVTKSDIVARPEYMRLYDSTLAHFQITVTTLDDELSGKYERASPPSRRIRAIRQLQEGGYDVSIRLSPIIEPYMDFDQLNSLGIDKAVVEFLRANSWVRKWFDIDYSKYTLRQNGYSHLPLDEKVRIIERIRIPSITVCEDVTEHYQFWRDHVNPNPKDCCNLRISPWLRGRWR